MEFAVKFLISNLITAMAFASSQPSAITAASVYGSAPTGLQQQILRNFGDDSMDPSEDELDAIGSEILQRRQSESMNRDRDRDEDRQPSRHSYGSRNSAGSGVDLSSISPELKNKHGVRKANPSRKSSDCYQLDPFTGYGPETVENFDFPDADLKELAKALAKLTCLNLVYDDKEVSGRISVVSNSIITIGDAWKVFLTALDVNGLALMPSADHSFYRITRQKEARIRQVPLVPGDKEVPNNDQIVKHLIPLKFINAEDVVRVFKNFMPVTSVMMAYEKTNTVIISDTGAKIKSLEEMIHLLDVETFDEQLEIIPVRYASASSVAKLIDQLISSSDPMSRSRYQGGMGPPPYMGPNAMSGIRKTREGGVISQIIPDDRTNSVIVSANAKGMEQVRKLVRRLDRRVSTPRSGSTVNTVQLRYADAEQLAQTLTSIVSGGPPTGSPAASNVMGTSAASLSNFEGPVKITPDKPTNTIIVTASPTDFLKVDYVIAELDIPRDQVYVEAVIMEMSVEKGSELGTTIALPTSGIGFQGNDDFAKFLTNPLSLSGLVLGFQKNHGGRTFTIPGGPQVTVASVQGLVKALQSHMNSNILSTPQILTLDNQEASIEVSENIPLLTTTAVQGAGSTMQSITRENIALILKITPQINKVGSVKLKITQKVQDISTRKPPSGVENLAFSTLTRASETTVVVKDGDTVALGGLVRDKVEDKTIKVPLLGDIPILGWLFRSKTTTSLKQNLIAFITPKVIKEYSDLRRILDEKIKDRDEFIDHNVGKDDVFKDFKDKMIRRLPPVQTLKDAERKPRVALQDQDAEDEEALVDAKSPVQKASDNSSGEEVYEDGAQPVEVNTSRQDLEEMLESTANLEI